MKEIPKGEIVADFMLGNTRIKINNAYCKNQTQEEKDAIIKRIEQIAAEGLAKKYGGIQENSQ